MGGNTTLLPRKGILMVIKVTRARVAQTRAIATPVVPGEPLEDFSKRVEDIIQRFRSEPVTPQRLLVLENALHSAAAETCRQVLEQEVNRLEPEDKHAMPGNVLYGNDTYPANK